MAMEVQSGIRQEPKAVLANERTAASWLKMSVMVGGIGAGLLGAARDYEKDDAAAGGVETGAALVAKLVGLVLMPVAIAFAAFAGYMFEVRRRKIAMRDYKNIGSETGPLVLGGALAFALLVVLLVDLIYGGAIRLK